MVSVLLIIYIILMTIALVKYGQINFRAEMMELVETSSLDMKVISKPQEQSCVGSSPTLGTNIAIEK